MTEKNACVYFMTNWTNEVLYIGVTTDLPRRLYEHRHKLLPGFTAKYNLSKLIYLEQTTDIAAAIAREKQLKKWRREKKGALVKAANPDWHDLTLDIMS